MQYNKEDFMQYVQQRIEDLQQYEYDELLQKAAALHSFTGEVEEQGQMEKQAIRATLRAMMPAFTTVGRANRRIARHALRSAEQQGARGFSKWRAADEAYKANRVASRSDAVKYLNNRNTAKNTIDPSVTQATNRSLNARGRGLNVQHEQQAYNNSLNEFQNKLNAPGRYEFNTLRNELEQLEAQGKRLTGITGEQGFSADAARKAFDQYAAKYTPYSQAVHNANEAAARAQGMEKMMAQHQHVARMQKSINVLHNRLNALHNNYKVDITKLQDPAYLKSLSPEQASAVRYYNNLANEVIKQSGGRLNLGDFQLGANQNAINAVARKGGFYKAKLSDYYTPKAYNPEAPGMQLPETSSGGWGRYILPAGIGFGAGMVPSMVSGGQDQSLQMQNAMLMQQLMQVKQNNDSFGNRLLNLFNSDTLWGR